jgi:hypothetical protein
VYKSAFTTFFLRKRKKPLRFISLKRGDSVCYKPTEGQGIETKKIQLSAHPRSRITRNPGAPALAQSAASSLICMMTVLVEGCIPSKTHLLRCFQTIHGVSSMMEAKPLRRGFGGFRENAKDLRFFALKR